ncbi:MAG: DUF3192 domain-containing protein [Candidatus Zixiibacteriota bacterium]
MMKNTMALLLILTALLGCAGMGAQMERFRARNRIRLQSLKVGMSQDSALAAMGSEVVEISNKWEVGPLNPRRQTQVLSNPYKTEIYAGARDTLDVFYYYAELKRQDGAISDDELVPLVFKEGRLLGWGHSFLQESITRYEIRFR